MKRGLALVALFCSTAFFSASQSAEQDRASDRTCSPTQLENMTGYFVSKDGFYGYPHRIEYLNIKLDAGFLVATKLVGDRNVPRGKVSWKTLSPYKCVDNQSKLPIKIQARMNINDPKAFFWIEEGNYVRIEDRNTLIVGFSCGFDCIAEGQLLRIQKQQAVDAENKMNDHY
jgi:hypothetical protein